MTSGTLAFTAPSDWEASAGRGDAGPLAARAPRRRRFGKFRLVTWIDHQTKQVTLMPVIEPPPARGARIRIGYRWASHRRHPSAASRTTTSAGPTPAAAAAWRGEPFEPFVPTEDTTPALYLGLDGPLPADRVGLYARDPRGRRESRPVRRCTWEAWDGSAWRKRDRRRRDTRARAARASSACCGPADDAPRARFGTPRTWLRARLRSAGTPPRRRRRAGAQRGLGIARRRRSSTRCRHFERRAAPDPLPDPHSGAARPGDRGSRARRAACWIEWPMLAGSSHRGVAVDDVRFVRDPRTGRETEVWVPWSERPSLLFSGPGDRHYAIERTRGRLIFGDGVSGRIPPTGANAIRARRYRAGGGAAGNVGAGRSHRRSQASSSPASATRAQRRVAPTASRQLAVLDRGPRTLREPPAGAVGRRLGGVGLRGITCRRPRPGAAGDRSRRPHRRPAG